MTPLQKFRKESTQERGYEMMEDCEIESWSENSMSMSAQEGLEAARNHP